MIISECVHANRVSPKYIFTDEYINFILEKVIYEIKVGSDQDIMKYTLKYLDADYIKTSLLKQRFSEIYGDKIKGKYFLSEDIKNNIENYYLLKSKFDDIYGLESYLISSSLNFKVDTYDKFIDSVVMYLILKSKTYNYDKEETLIYIYNYIKNFEENYNKLLTNIDKIKKNYYTLSLFNIFSFDNIDKTLLIKNNINTIKDFVNLNLYTIMYVISSDYENYLKNIESFGISIKKIIDDAFSVIEEKNLEIIIRRNGYIDSNRCTLEQIGSELNVTRERIRQLEAKNLKKISLIAADNYNILISFFNSELGKRKPYITLDKLVNKYDDSFINKILLLFEYGNGNVVYDSTYQIIYDKSINNIDNMINDVMNKIGIVAEPSELEKSDLFTLNVIKNNYKEVTKELYLKKGCIYRDLYLVLLEELFPKGYRAGNDEDYDIFVKTVNERYKINENIPSKHSLEAMIGRGNFIQSDRGEYISNKYAINLEKEMIDKILSYISENEFTYYNAIFEKFSSELKKVGIKNRYYLKGCIDKHLPSDMTTKRDYIVCGDTNKTPYEIILNQLHSFEGKFTRKELQKIFPGIKDYTIYNFLYSEIEKGLIWISSNEFIYASKYNIDENTKTELKTFIDNLFSSLNTKLVTSKKIYAKLQLTNKELYKKLNLTNGHFELFSVIKAIYNNYYYSRPYIFLEENAYNTRSTIIQDYVRQYDSFNFKMIQDYQSKMNIGGLYSYLEFMENMSDEYVQVDIDEMVKIEKLNLNEVTIKEIKRVIDLILDNFNVIETSKFNAYSLLPKISYVWNKYLLVGIIRSYLSEYYDIKNTENTYSNTDFEVRRSKYE